jgi:arginine deiminase
MPASKKIEAEINSEIGKIETVIIHSPGPEVEKMTPSTAERALYSDILNLPVASREYSQFKGILGKFAQILEVRELLSEVLKSEQPKKELLHKISNACESSDMFNKLIGLPDNILVSQLIEGVLLEKNNLTSYLSKNSYALNPLHNFFFTRDSSFVINNSVFIGKMAKKVRMRESLIMESIFNYHPQFQIKANNPDTPGVSSNDITIEGGDIIVFRKDILIAGIGTRTSPQGVDYIIGKLCKDHEEVKHVIVQELPHSPESFIHLDMVLTFIDEGMCIVYEPVIFNRIDYQTVLITIDKGKVKKIETFDDIIRALKKLKIDVKAIPCGGKNKTLIQEREQWHSGANFFTLAPGKITGYERNIYTNEELNRQGFEIIQARDVLSGKNDIDKYNKYLVTIQGGELARGGGGPRCMTLPVRRKNL